MKNFVSMGIALLSLTGASKIWAAMLHPVGDAPAAVAPPMTEVNPEGSFKLINGTPLMEAARNTALGLISVVEQALRALPLKGSGDDVLAKLLPALPTAAEEQGIRVKIIDPIVPNTVLLRSDELPIQDCTATVAIQATLALISNQLSITVSSIALPPSNAANSLTADAIASGEYRVFMPLLSAIEKAANRGLPGPAVIPVTPIN